VSVQFSQVALYALYTPTQTWIRGSERSMTKIHGLLLLPPKRLCDTGRISACLLVCRENYAKKITGRFS